MKISVDWLGEYVKVPENTGGLVEELTMVGIEVEGVKELSVPASVIVCEIIECLPHPNADKLNVCKISSGGTSEELQVVCGAPNARKGLRTAFAPAGTTFKYREGECDREYVIEERPLRGVVSKGMLCSAKELGISEDGDGIIELPAKYAVGSLLNECIGKDTVLDLEITPNRPDLYCHFGIAREISAICGKKAKLKSVKVPEPAEIFPFTVRIDDRELCPFYTARIIRGVKVKPSPAWLVRRLENIGLRPINNVVDITNFVLHETGQPLHAFDLGRLSGGEIIVRRAEKGETMEMLDGTEIRLKGSYLVIADKEKPIALAGVMGGKYSGVGVDTVDILLESAYFKAQNVRMTSRNAELSTDSSYRFERGVDSEMVEKASNRATSLILALAGGKIASQLIFVGEKPVLPSPVPCRYEKIRNLIGIEIPDKEITGIFKRLGFRIEKGKGACTVHPPSFRHDIKTEADLTEEVARIHGISNIPTIQIKADSGGSIRNDSYARIETLHDQLLSLGLDECYTYSLTSKQNALSDSDFSENDLIEISNPINRDFTCMRPSLFSGMIQSVEYNISRRNTDLALFELGRAFCHNSAKYPEERLECCIAMTGRRHPERFSAEREICHDYYDLKGVLESWLEMRKIRRFTFAPCANANFAEDACAELFVNGEKCGILGKISDKLTASLRLRTSLFVAKVNVDKIILHTPDMVLFKPVSLFPSTSRDLAFIAGAEFRHQKFVSFVESLNVLNLEGVELFDEFRDESFGTERKSLAYSLTYRNEGRTLTDAEVNEAHEKLRSTIQKELGIELR